MIFTFFGKRYITKVLIPISMKYTLVLPMPHNYGLWDIGITY